MQSTIEITIASAWSTLQILDRQARKDCGKVAGGLYSLYLILSSRQAMQTYRALWQLLVIIAMIAWALCLEFGAANQRCDREVHRCQTVKESVTVNVDSEPETEPQISDAIVPFVRPQLKAETIDWAAMTPYQLRHECQVRGIKWRNVYGKNKHMKKAEMIAALKR